MKKNIILLIVLLVQLTYDYFLNTFGRDSCDDNGSPIYMCPTRSPSGHISLGR
jgi:hypothetical protein